MPVRVGINGFGRIGRNVFRAAKDRDLTSGAEIEWVAVNDLTDARTLAHLLRYDSVLGPFPGTVEHGEQALQVDGRELKVLAERDPAALPWRELGVDVVIESTGLFTDRDSAAKHLAQGARKVVISAPAADPDVTVAIGVNFEQAYDRDKHDVIIVTEKLHIPAQNLALFPLLKSAIILGFFFVVMPQLNKMHYKLPMVIGFLGFVASQLVLIAAPDHGYVFLIISVFLEACSFAAVSPLTDPTRSAGSPPMSFARSSTLSTYQSAWL